ncbi:MAG: anti-sigma factor [Acidobacteriota bacterium]|nr:anti-sigma factor [Acidobacteriota bacterium]
MSELTESQPETPDPSRQVTRGNDAIGAPNSRSGGTHRSLAIALLACGVAILLFATVLMGLRQRQLGTDLQQSLSESKARGMLELNLLDKAMGLVHDEKIERIGEVGRLGRELEDVREKSLTHASDLYRLKRGFVEIREQTQQQKGEFKKIDERLVRMHRDADERKKQLAHVDRALSLLNDPDAQQVVFGRRTRNQPRGKVYTSLNQLVILLASNLPPLPLGKTYEFWLIAKGAEPSPGGLFQSDSDGTAIHMAAMNNISAAAIAVSVEEELGAPSPTTKPVLMVEIPSQSGQQQ